MVKVIIERHCQQGKEEELKRVLSDLGRRVETGKKAFEERGYVSGETITSVDDPAVWLVLSTWRSVEQWYAWEASPQRVRTEREIERLLTGPAKASLFNFVWGADQRA
ncbi:MAG: antibiotic biosynthesis monooxygenase [Chloroflexi bacterium]|nr:antibiotic biosynthesis monooxygenase [Chloroflexota bacterium]